MTAVDAALAELARLCESGTVPSAEEFCSKHGSDPALRLAVEDFLFMWEGIRPAAPPPPGPPFVSPPPAALGEFHIHREIGRGGMGVVYEAEQVPLRRRVAVKVLPAHLTLRPASVERFRREAATAARLRHPGIVEIFTVGESGGSHYFAMELVEGTPLSERLEALKGLALLPLDGRSLVPGGLDKSHVAAAARVAFEVAEALDYAHRNGVVHRDVKPSNILLRQDGRAVLTDFGLAREESLEGLTQSGHFGGTPHYVSPEQAAGGRHVDGRADVFSLGVTLYEMLTLRRPFEGETPQAVLREVLHAQPAPPSAWNPRVPKDLTTIVVKCLEKEPADRYASAAVLAADLLAFLELRPISASPVSSLTRAVRWSRREPAKATAAALGALVVLGGAFGAGFVAPRLVDAADRARRDEAEDAAAAGFLAAADRDDAKALSHFERALNRQADMPEAILGTEMILTRGAKPSEGLDFVDAALRRRGPTPELRRIRLDALRAVGRDAEALTLAAELGEPRTDVEAFVEAAALLRRAGESERSVHRRCVELLDRAILHSNRARAVYYYELAYAAVHAKDLTTARRVGLALEQLWPRSPRALRRAAFAWSLCDVKHSIELYERSLELDPTDASGASELAAAQLSSAKDVDAAIAAGRRAVALDPQLARARVVLAAALSAKGSAAEAEPELRKAIELDGRSWQARLNLGLILASRKDTESALAELAEAVKLAPRESKPHAVYGWTLRGAGRRQEALAPLTKACELDDGDFEPLQMRATVTRELGDFAAALPLLERARDLAPDKPFVVRDYGIVLQALGRPEEALTQFRRYLELHPKSTDAHLRIGLALEATGDWTGALEALREAETRLPAAAKPEARAVIVRIEAKLASPESRAVK